MTRNELGWQARAIEEYDFNNNLEFNSGILFAKKGVSLHGAGENRNFRLRYMQLPLNVGYDFPIDENSCAFFV